MGRREKMEQGGGGRGTACLELSATNHSPVSIGRLPDGGGCGSPRLSTGLGSTCTKAGTAPVELGRG